MGQKFGHFGYPLFDQALSKFLRKLQFFRPGKNSLRLFHQVADAPRIALAMTMAGERVCASTGFNDDIRPEHSRFNMYRCDLADTDADLIFAEDAPLVAGDCPVGHLDGGGKEMVSLRPAACFECLAIHAVTLVQENIFSMAISKISQKKFTF